MHCLLLIVLDYYFLPILTQPLRYTPAELVKAMLLIFVVFM